MLKTRKNIGRFDYLKNKLSKPVSRSLLPQELTSMPFYKYAIALATYLDGQYFADTLIVGQARRETDITWFLKDFTVNLDFIAEDFSDFKKDPDLFTEVNFIEENFLDFQSSKQYDLIVVVDDMVKISPVIDQYMNQLYNLSQDQGRIIFFIRYFYPELKIKSDDILLNSSEEILKSLPFEVRSKVELKNYNKNKISNMDLIMDTYKL